MLTPEQKARLDAYAKQKAAQTATLPAPVAPTAPVGLTPEQRARLDAYAKQKQAQAIPQAPKEDGFLKSMAKGIAQPFVKAGVTGLSALDAGLQLAMGDTAGADKTITEGYNVPGFGQVKPLGIASTPTIVKDYAGRERLEGGEFGRETLKTIGTGAEIAPWFFGAGQAANLAKEGFKAPLKQTAKMFAREGFVEGLVGGAGSALQKDDATLGSVAKDAALGSAFGAVLGAGVPLVGAAGSKLLTKGSPEAALPKAARKAQKAASKDAVELKKITRKTPALQKYVDRAKKQDFDVEQAIAETDLVANSVDENGLINTVQEGGAVDRVNAFLEPLEGRVGEALEQEGRKISISQLRGDLMKAVKDSGAEGAALTRATNAVEEELKGLAVRADANGLVPLSTVHKAKMYKYRNINYLDPSAARLDKSIARRMKEIVEKNTDSIDVKAYNEELSKFYTMLGYLEKLNNKRVEGGRLGKYFAQAVGAVAGSSFGPFGAIAGSELGGLLRGKAMKSIFSEAAGRQGPKVTARMADAIRPRPPQNFPLLPAPRRPLPDPNAQYIPSKSRLLSQEEARAALQNTLLDPTRAGQNVIPLKAPAGPTPKQQLQMKRDDIKALREQVALYRFPDEQLEDGYRQFKALAQRSPDSLNPDMDWESFSRRYGNDKAQQIIEDSISGGGPYGMTNNEALDAFKTRYITERLINRKADEMAKKLKRGENPSVSISPDEAAVFAAAPLGGMEVTYDENGKPVVSFNAEKAAQSMLLGGGLIAGKKTLSKRGTSVPKKASKTTSLPAKLANSADASLLAEAKKYKTAEEFVKAHGTPVYHGTSLENASKINIEGFKAGSGKGVSGQASNDFIYATSNKTGANRYVSDRMGIKNPTVIEGGFTGRVLEIQGKMADFEAFGEASKKLGVPLGIGSQGKPTMLNMSALQKAMGEQGYGAISFSDRYANGAKAFAILPDQIKTKAQLLDIWKRVNKS